MSAAAEVAPGDWLSEPLTPAEAQEIADMRPPACSEGPAHVFELSRDMTGGVKHFVCACGLRAAVTPKKGRVLKAKSPRHAVGQKPAPKTAIKGGLL